MSTRLVDIKNELDAKELQAKIASVNQHWGSNEQALAILCDAMAELEKEAAAGSFGDAGLSDSQLLSLGVMYTDRLLSELAKEATEEVAEESADEAEAEVTDEVADEADEAGDEEISEELQEKMAEAYEIAFALGRELGQRGLPSEELAKVASASEEDAEDFARFLAQLSHELFTETEG